MDSSGSTRKQLEEWFGNAGLPPPPGFTPLGSLYAIYLSEELELEEDEIEAELAEWEHIGGRAEALFFDSLELEIRLEPKSSP